MKKSLLLTTLLLATLTEAKEILPKGCNPLVLDGPLISIPKGKPRLIAFHNLTKTDLWMTHPVTDAQMSASLSSRLQGNKWSLLKMDQTAFILSCIESKPGHEQQVACLQVVSACEWPTTTKHEKKSIFWVAENKSLSVLIAYATRQGWMPVPVETRE